jgi:hypothetical protein
MLAIICSIEMYLAMSGKVGLAGDAAMKPMLKDQVG